MTHSHVFRLSVQGPVVGWREDARVELGPPRQRALICVLAGRLGEMVTREQLFDGVWGETVPRTAEQSVYNYVAALRRVLEPGRGRRGDAEVLVSKSYGYLLRPKACVVDADEFARHLVRDADRQGDVRELDPHRVQRPIPQITTEPIPLAQDQALTWLDREHENLLAVASQAMRSSHDDHRRLGIGLGYALIWHLHRADAK
jgi:two-component SAPR family response regulator